MLPEQQQRIMGYFIEEAKDHLNTIEQGLLSLQATIEDSEKANEVFRAAHSVKGGAAMLGLESIQTIAHRMEDYFKILKESSVQVDSTLETMFLRVSDGLKDLLEQLEGPFGLTPEKAQEIMTDVDPVFSQLEKHLDSLVAASGGVKDGAIAPTSATADALQVTFKQDVPTLLRQLLSAFKQADTVESRRSLHNTCTELHSIGQRFELSAWCDLIDTARLATEEASNEYRVLAPILIKEIKKSQGLVLSGRASEVGVSEALQALLPEDILATADTAKTDAHSPAELNAIETGFDSDTSLFSEASPDDGDLFADGLFDAEIDTNTEDLDELFGLNTNNTDPVDLSESALEISDKSDLSDTSHERVSAQHELAVEDAQGSSASPASVEQSLTKEPEVSLAEEPASRLDIDLDFNEIPSELSALNRDTDTEERADESLDALLATVNVTGPDVGTEELNSLADLFDGDLEELDNTLGGHPFVSEEMRLHPEKIDLEEEDDLTDLLTDDNLAHSESSNDDRAETDEMEDDLFGGTLTEGGFADIAELDLDEAVELDLDEAVELDLDEAVELNETASIEKDVDNSLDTDLAALAEDPWAEQEEEDEEKNQENELENLFGTAANSFDVGEEIVAPGSELEPTEAVAEGDQDGLSFDGLEENMFGGGDFDEAAFDENDFDENDFDGNSLEESSFEENSLQEKTSISETQPLGNLSSGLFAVEPVSPSEQEIEFPTLTGVKLEEAEKDIDSFFFDSPTDESDDFLNEAIAEKEPVVALTEDQLSEDPWGELNTADALLPNGLENEEDDNSFSIDGLDLSGSGLDEPDLDEPDLDEPDPDELDLDGLDLSGSDLDEPDLDEPDLTTSNLTGIEADNDETIDSESLDFDLPTISGEQINESTTQSSLSELANEHTLPLNSADSLFDTESPLSESPLSTENDIDENQAIAAPQADNITDNLWDDLSLPTESTVSSINQKQSIERGTAVEIEATENADDIDADIDTVFSVAYALDSISEVDVSLDDGVDKNASDNAAVLDNFLMETSAEETASQETVEISDELSSEDDFLGLEDLFVENTDPVEEVPAAAPQAAGESSLTDSLDNFLDDDLANDESVDDWLTNNESANTDSNDESVDDWLTTEPTIEATHAEKESAATSLEQFPTIDGLSGDLGDSTVSTLENTNLDQINLNENDTDSDDFLLDFETTSPSEPEERLTQTGIDSAEIAELAPQAAEIDSDGAFDFDDLDALLGDDDEPISPGTTNALSDTFGGTAQTKAPANQTPTNIGTGQTESAIEEEDDEDFDDLERLLEDGDGESVSSAAIARRATPRAPRRSNPAREQNMRVPVKHLDNLSNLVGELVVNRNTLERDQERLRQFLDNLLFQVQQLNDVGQRMRDLYERSLLESSLVSSRKAHAAGNSPKTDEPENHATGATFDALEMDRFTGFHTLSQEMIELIVRVRESSSDIGYTVESSDQVTRQFRQVTTQLQEGLNTARMVAFSQAADRLPRAVRDISLKCGKEARLIVEGKDTLIDKMIVEHLYDPLTHLVNNAITHGVETPAERKAAGKQPEGSITVQAFYQGNQTVIYVADDGGGINPAFVQRKAVEKQLITQAEAAQLSDIETYELLFHPGFSTRDQADDFAGRGVGMDVVRTSLAEIRGVITIDSEQGKGTSFTIRLPLTLSISKALSCVSNQARIAFPMDGVEDMLDVPRDRIIQNEEGQDCVKWRDRILPFQAVTDLLKFNRTLGRGRVYGGSQDDDVLSIIVLRSANTFVAIQVDQVIGEEEIVIKQLEGPVPKPLGIAGATILGDGRVMPIADVIELIDIAVGRVRREPSSLLWAESAEAEEEITAKADPTVLIVDDSITVRELLSMSFNKVGYRVEQARDGQEAWDKLRSGLPCDLVFCDIEMPRMDGLELLSRMQKDNHLKSVPIAMLTSRGADRHRQMAVDLGASGYFTKPYLEEALLDAAQRMLNGETLAKGRGG